DLFDEAPLDRLGELDLADPARHFDPRPERAEPHTTELPLVLLCRRRDFFQRLAVVDASLPDVLDLSEHFRRALLNHLVGDFLVAEDNQLADRPIAGAQLVAHDEDALGDGRRARDRLDHRQLAPLDALGDGHLALAREQGYGAHLTEIHADRIVGLIERARGEVELGAILRAVAIEVLVGAVRLVGIDDFDSGAAEGIEQVIEILRGGDLRREHLVDLVVEQVTLLFTDGDQLAYFVVSFFKRQGLPPKLWPAPN